MIRLSLRLSTTHFTSSEGNSVFKSGLFTTDALDGTLPPLGAATIIILVRVGFAMIHFPEFSAVILFDVLHLFTQSFNKVVTYHTLRQFGNTGFRSNRIHLTQQFLCVKIKLFTSSRPLAKQLAIILNMLFQSQSSSLISASS